MQAQETTSRNSLEKPLTNSQGLRLEILRDAVKDGLKAQDQEKKLVDRKAV